MSILAVLEQRSRPVEPHVVRDPGGGAAIGAANSATRPARRCWARASTALADELATKQLDKVYAVEHELLEDYTPDGYSRGARQLHRPRAARSWCSSRTPTRCATSCPSWPPRSSRVAVSDVVAHRIEDGQVVLVRQLFQGKVNADVRFAGDGPHFASLQAGAYRADQVAEGAATVEVVHARDRARADPHRAAGAVPRIAARGGSGRGRNHRLGGARN